MQGSKSLILFRHAKSDWDASYATDHDRPLANRGVNAAKTMGKLLASSGKLPDLIVCSTAVRAMQTLELANQAGDWHCETLFTDELYEASVTNAIRVVQQLPANINSVMLVGHEPTWSYLTSTLIGGGSIRFPTAAMVRIDFYFDNWRSIDAASGQLRWLLQPRFFTN